jgi:hypothetical protein
MARVRIADFIDRLCDGLKKKRRGVCQHGRALLPLLHTGLFLGAGFCKICPYARVN